MSKSSVIKATVNAGVNIAQSAASKATTKFVASKTGQQLVKVKDGVIPAVKLAAKGGAMAGAIAVGKEAYSAGKLYSEGTAPLSDDVINAQISEMIKEKLIKSADIVKNQFTTHIVERHNKNMESETNGMDKMTAKVSYGGVLLDVMTNNSDSTRVHTAVKAVSSSFDIATAGLPLFAANTAKEVVKEVVQPIANAAAFKAVDLIRTLKQNSNSANVPSSTPNVKAKVKEGQER